MATINLTKKEEEWIRELKGLIRKKPGRIVLFADGNLNVLKPDAGDNDSLKENGRMDSDKIVAVIQGACDGGGF